MLNDERKHIRKLAYRRILNYRLVPQAQFRTFVLPTFNMDASEYFEMIDWQYCGTTEPPITRSINNEGLKEIVETGILPKQFLSYSCHSQAVERSVKVVTEASGILAGTEACDGHIRSKLIKIN